MINLAHEIAKVLAIGGEVHFKVHPCVSVGLEVALVFNARGCDGDTSHISRGHGHTIEAAFVLAASNAITHAVARAREASNAESLVKTVLKACESDDTEKT